jgi:hypothetical protein
MDTEWLARVKGESFESKRLYARGCFVLQVTHQLRPVCRKVCRFLRVRCATELEAKHTNVEVNGSKLSQKSTSVHGPNAVMQNVLHGLHQG